MEYFFIPGRLKDLSFAELKSVSRYILGYNSPVIDKGEYFILKTDLDSSLVKKVFLRLGGFLKYGIVLDTDVEINDLVSSDKVVFGISSYSSKFHIKEIKDLSRSFKNEFVNIGKKVRFVLPKKEISLSTAQVSKNKLIEDGLELVILNEKMGKTLEIQDIEGFSLRDYSKPFVDSEMGVLPIKLSRIMINLAEIKEGSFLWDPFCGTGNVLLEGLDLGYNVLGSDIDTEGLKGAEKNLKWASNRFNYKKKSKVFYLDVLNPTPSKVNILNNFNIAGIVCEPYMGKPQRKTLEINEANSLLKQHYSLVSGLFKILDNLDMDRKIKVVVIFPEYKTKKGWVSIEKGKINFKNAKLIEKDLHWSRENSIIKRLIFVFEYKFK